MARTTTSSRTAVTTVLNLNTALSFNGSSDYVSIPDNAVYSYATASALSISCWINPSTLAMPAQESTGYVDFLTKDGSNTNEWAFRMYQTGNSEGRNNRISFYIFAAAGGLGDGVFFEDVIVPGQWIHLCATIDGSKNIRLYKNGKLRNVFLASSLTLTDTASVVKVGAASSNSATISSYFKGKIDDVRFYDKVLNSQEINDIYLKNSSSPTGIVGWFKFDEGSGTTATDSSVTANNGTIVGGTYVTSYSRGRLVTGDSDPVKLNTIDTTPNIAAQRLLVRGGKSLSINGSTQYASIANASQVGLDIGTSDFMVGGWYKIKVGTAIQVLMAKYSGSGYALSNTGNIGFDFLYRGDQAGKPLQFRVTDGTNNATCATSTGQLNLADGNWHFIAVYGSRTGTAKFVIDGTLIQTQSISNTTGTLTSTGAFIIGTREDATTGFMSGLVSDVFFYVFPAGVPSNIRTIVDNIYRLNRYDTTGLVSDWSFNNVATDSVGGNTLVLTGSPSYSTDHPVINRTNV